MSENNGELGAFLAGFVIGGLVGAATALILAPKSGQEIRAQIAERSQSLQQAGGERWEQYRSTASNTLAGTRERMQEVGGQVQEQARIVLDAGREQAAKVRDQVAPTTHQDDAGTTETAEPPVADEETPDQEESETSA